MSLRAKDMLALSAGDDRHGASGNGSPVSSGVSPGGGSRPAGNGFIGNGNGNGSTGVLDGNSNSNSSASVILSGIADDSPAAPAAADESEVRFVCLFVFFCFRDDQAITPSTNQNLVFPLGRLPRAPVPNLTAGCCVIDRLRRCVCSVLWPGMVCVVVMSEEPLSRGVELG